MPDTHRCKVKLIGRGCDHDLCVPINRGLPSELRCPDGQSAGYGGGGSACSCRVPDQLSNVVERELRDNFQECKRRGFVIIAAA